MSLALPLLALGSPSVVAVAPDGHFVVVERPSSSIRVQLIGRVHGGRVSGQVRCSAGGGVCTTT